MTPYVLIPVSACGRTSIDEFENDCHRMTPMTVDNVGRDGNQATLKCPLGVHLYASADNVTYMIRMDLRPAEDDDDEENETVLPPCAGQRGTVTLPLRWNARP